MATYRDTVSDTLHELDPATFGEKMLAALIANGTLEEVKPARKAPAAKAEPPVEAED